MTRVFAELQTTRQAPGHAPWAETIRPARLSGGGAGYPPIDSDLLGPERRHIHVCGFCLVSCRSECGISCRSLKK